jgi:molybdenum cofactor sulfurtransferase
MGHSHSKSERPEPLAIKGLARKPSKFNVQLPLGSDSDSSLVQEKATFTRITDSNTFSPQPQKPTFQPASTQDSETIKKDGTEAAYKAFIRAYPEYKLTWILDTLRENDFRRLKQSGETYVDYMGGSLYPESLVHANSEFLKQSLLGNTHSVSNRYASRRPTTFDASFDYLFVSSSKLSTGCADEAREAVLSFFRAPPGYTVVFTANATGALKLVGEAYPFTEESTYVLGVDSHNSVHGIREFARRAGARVCYIESTSQGGFDLAEAKVKKAQ